MRPTIIPAKRDGRIVMYCQILAEDDEVSRGPSVRLASSLYGRHMVSIRFTMLFVLQQYDNCTQCDAFVESEEIFFKRLSLEWK